MRIISNMNILREISSYDDGITDKELLASRPRHCIPCPWKGTHIHRVQVSLTALLKKGLIWLDERQKYLVTDLGKKRLKA